MSDRDRLLAMAREARDSVTIANAGDGDINLWHDDHLRAFAALVRADEREKCALAVEGLFGGLSGKWGSENSDRYRAQDETRALAAAAIRARSEP